MTSQHSANPPNFPEDSHFNSTNYISFKSHVMIAACALGARGYLEGTIKRPDTSLTDPNASTTDPTNESKAVAQTDLKVTDWSSKTPSAEEWDERDTWALGLIIYNSKNPALTDNYGAASEIAALNAERKLRAAELTEGADFLKHVEDLWERWKSATEKGATFSLHPFPSPGMPL
ncbi:hypothetical protein H0H87_011331 [Tephrocybe sp. NHM501043]|nr:hypothetical protein H0H87_011331 [Tephrocybe sp. NHM501043]